MSNIPKDILGDIFSRLSVKSLVRFKCVCKTWLSLISDSSFAILKFKQSDKNSPHKILISTSSLLQSLDCSTTSFGGDGALRKLDFPYKRPDNIIHVIGSCNGLICIALNDYKQFFIWNPTTGAYRSLPELDIPSHGNRCVYGFGYDLSSDQYKVFFATRSNNVDASNDTDVRIFATKANCWRRIQLNSNIPCCDAFYWQQSKGSLLNESLHWLSCRLSECKAIAAFNLAEEKLIELPVPSICSYYLETLGVVDGCLCLIIRGLGVRELWMMKKYGSNHSWEKLITFGKRIGFVYDNYYSKVPNNMVPLCSTRGHEVILMANGNELISCKLWGKPHRERTLQRLKIDKKFFGTMEATAYIESLMSPL